MGPVNYIFTILLCFERFKKNIKFFSSAKANNNQLFILIYGLNTQILRLFKNNYRSYMTTLIDITGVDLTKLNNYNIFFNVINWNFYNNYFTRLVYYNILDYKNNTRYIFTTLSATDTEYYTLERVFFNSNWLERELVEFFNVNIVYKSDTRNLLLDYNSTANPLLRSYPTEGHQELFFNYLSYNLEYVSTEFVEL